MAEDALGVISAALVEAIHVKLPDEGIHLAVPEVSRQHDGLKFVDVLDDELGAGGGPVGDLAELLILDQIEIYIQNFKGLSDESCNLGRFLLVKFV